MRRPPYPKAHRLPRAHRRVALEALEDRTLLAVSIVALGSPPKTLPASPGYEAYLPGALNDAGQVIGSAVDDDPASRTYGWDQGYLYSGGTFTHYPWGADAGYVALNNSGVAVGGGPQGLRSTSAGSDALTGAYPPDKWSPGKGLYYGSAWCSAVDAAGDAVGTCEGYVPDASFNPVGPQRQYATIWKAGTTIPTFLPIPGDSSATGVNSAGDTFVGYYIDQQLFDQAFVYKAGQFIPLPGLPGTSGSEAVGVSDDGDIIGTCGSGTGVIWRFAAQAGAYVPLPLSFTPEHINSSSVVVGEQHFDATHSTLMLWSAQTGAVDLNTLVPPELGWHLNSVVGINASGQLTGYGTHNGLNVGYLASGLDPNDAFVVTNTNDQGPGSLRQALLNADNDASLLGEGGASIEVVSGPHTISFRIGAGPATISLATALPPLRHTVGIDGTTQPGYTDAPLVEIDGSNVAGDGLVIQADSTTVKGLRIANFKGGNGISISASDVTIGGPEPGAGNVIADNGKSGVSIPTWATDGFHNRIRGNQIYGNGGIAIDLGGDGPTANTLTPSPYAPNKGQNYPGISRVGGAVYLTLVSTPNTNFDIDFYLVGPTSAAYVTAVSGRTDQNGTLYRQLSMSQLGVPPASSGLFLTATATDEAGNTSEMLPGAGTIGELAVPDQDVPADLNLLEPNLRAAVTKFLASLPSDADATVTSTYRPTDYQALFYELKTKFLELLSDPGVTTDPQLIAPGKYRPRLDANSSNPDVNDLATEVNWLLERHKLRATKDRGRSPAANPPLSSLHSVVDAQGRPAAQAVDIVFAGTANSTYDAQATAANLFRPYPGAKEDNVHYQLIGTPVLLEADVTVASPVNILITDPQGRRLGNDPSTGDFLNEIDPGATDTGPDSEPRVFHIPLGAVVPGAYTVTGVGTGSGPYHVYMQVTGDDPEDVFLDDLIASGTISPGQPLPAISPIDALALATTATGPGDNSGGTDTGNGATSGAGSGGTSGGGSGGTSGGTSGGSTSPLLLASGIGAFDSASGMWYLRNEVNGGAPDAGSFAYGLPGWVGVVGDWNGDGTATVGVVDTSTGMWYLRNSNTPGTPDIAPFAFGLPGWEPIVGDWTGTGRSGIGMFDPATGMLYIRSSPSAGAPDSVFPVGLPGMIPLAGDFFGLGHSGVGVVDPATMTWYLKAIDSSGNLVYTSFAYGAPGWKVAVGDWDGNGTATPAVFDPTSATWLLRNSNSAGFPDVGQFAYGVGSWQPVAGTWAATASLLAEGQGESTSAPLSAEQLQQTVSAALARLAQAGVSAATLQRLSSASYSVAALPAGTLGLAQLGGSAAFFSADGAGHGWFVDPTPNADEEFSVGSPGSPLVALPGSAAAGQEDLLTAVLHEMGTLAGRQDGAGVMADVLPTGTRRTDALDAAFAAG